MSRPAFLLGALLLLIVLVLPRPGAAQEVSLRPGAVIDAPVIRLGDLFAGLGPAALTPVGDAPAPGARLVFESAQLAELAVRHRVDWRPVGGERAVVERLATRFDAEAIATAIGAEALLRGLVGPEAVRVEVLLDNRTTTLTLPAAAPSELRVERLDHDPQRRRFSASLEAAAGTPFARRLEVTGRLVAVIQVPVPAVPIAPGQVLAQADLRLAELAEDRVPLEAVRDPAALVGHAPRRALRPDVPVSSRDVRPPQVVRRGQLVTLMVASGPMVLTARGRALEDGAAGMAVRVTNLASQKVVVGTADATGTVHVDLSRLPAALN